MAKPTTKRKWEDEISDPKARKVFEALADPKWDFRTVEGLSKSTGLSQEEVMKVILEYPNFIRKSSVPDQYGQEIYALKGEGAEKLETVSTLVTFISKSIR